MSTCACTLDSKILTVTRAILQGISYNVNEFIILDKVDGDIPVFLKLMYIVTMVFGISLVTYSFLRGTCHIIMLIWSRVTMTGSLSNQETEKYEAHLDTHVIDINGASFNMIALQYELM